MHLLPALQTTRTYCVAAAVAWSSLSCANSDGLSATRSFPLRQAAAAALAKTRPFEARLSGSALWIACPNAVDDGAGQCSEPPNANARSHLSGLLTSRPAKDSADVVWTAAAIDLAARPALPRLDAIINELNALADRVSPAAQIRNDLAVAYLARHTIRHDAMSLFLALDQLERAQRDDSTSTEIRFNRALVYARLNLYESARVAWREMLAADSTSPWSAEITSRLATVEHDAARRQLDGTERITAAHALANPRLSREWVLYTGVKNWSDRVRAGDVAGARTVVRMIEDVGVATASRSRDSSIFHVARDLAVGTGVANAVAMYVAATVDYRRGDFISSERNARPAIVILRGAGRHALADWTEIMLAGVDITRSDFRVATIRTTDIGRRARARGDIAAVARASWFRALIEAREGNAAAAIDDYGEARRLYEQIGERANEGSMLSQQADVFFLLGRDDTTFSLKEASLKAFGIDRSPVLRAGPLLGLARQLTDVGLIDAGLAVLREAALSGRKSERAPDGPEALIRLAAAQAAAGTNTVARATLEEARVALRAVRDTLMRDRMQMEVANAEATILMEGDRRLAVRRLDEAAHYFRQRKILYDLAGPLVRAANLRLQLGDTTDARANLTEAATSLESQALKSNDRSGARAIAASRREVYGALLRIHLARDSTKRAFIVSEQARGNRISSIPILGKGQLALAFSVFGDNAVGWVVFGDSLRMFPVAGSVQRLSELAGQLERSARGQAPAPTDTADAGRALYDLLAAPAAEHIRLSTELRIVTDGLLGRIPFEALKGPDGRYLVQQVAISYAAAVRPFSPVRVDGRMLVVGNPEHDETLFPDLGQLRAASDEATRVQSAHRNAVLLAGPGATKTSFLEAYRSVSALHFAGHARLVNRAPLLSDLVFAREAGGTAANSLTAREIEQLPLSHLKLVVLSSCGTTQQQTRRDSGESGLAESFLNAGVGAVVSSLWEVDDGSTATLMELFHQHLARGDSPAQALRAAQTAVIDSQPSRASPRFWSGFRVEQR